MRVLLLLAMLMSIGSLSAEVSKVKYKISTFMQKIEGYAIWIGYTNYWNDEEKMNSVRIYLQDPSGEAVNFVSQLYPSKNVVYKVIHNKGQIKVVDSRSEKIVYMTFNASYLLKAKEKVHPMPSK